MRIKGAMHTRKRKKKIFKHAKGFRGSTGNVLRHVLEKVDNSLQHAYRDRRKKKRDFRALWIIRINAASRIFGMSYSQLISGLKKANVEVNRKMLAELAVNDNAAFAQLVNVAKGN
ncbi:MAG: 50S ribosomal protein L20 [Elusimicrobiota bacterium]